MSIIRNKMSDEEKELIRATEMILQRYDECRGDQQEAAEFIILRAALIGVQSSVCDGDPLNCEHNEGYGCDCS